MKSRQVLGLFLIHRTLMPLPAVFAAGNMRHPQHATTARAKPARAVIALLLVAVVDGIASTLGSVEGGRCGKAAQRREKLRWLRFAEKILVFA